MCVGAQNREKFTKTLYYPFISSNVFTLDEAIAVK